jgi:hypothetical protein
MTILLPPPTETVAGITELPPPMKIVSQDPVRLEPKRPPWWYIHPNSQLARDIEEGAIILAQLGRMPLPHMTVIRSSKVCHRGTEQVPCAHDYDPNYQVKP